MRSVIPGMERLSSLVRLGPSCRRHRIVPFQRPSMTRIIASTGHSPFSFFETGIFPSNTDKYDSTLTLVSIHHTLRVMEVFLSNKHLPRLFVQALNEKRVELFEEFIRPEYNNHNAYVEPGPAGVKAFFRHYLERRFTQEEATMRTFELRVYKLRTKEALDFYMEKIYPRHLSSFPVFGIEAHGFWTPKEDAEPRLFVLASYAAGGEPPDGTPGPVPRKEFTYEYRNFDV